MKPPEPPTDYTYVGTELEVFRHARNWKQYYRSRISPYIQGSVLEVGAGIGATTRVLCSDQANCWVCLEPDPMLARRIGEEHRREPYPVPPQVIVGTLETLEPTQTFDCLLYIDVLEHIEDDGAEFQRAAVRLKPGGSLVILCPAHQYLYSEFDRSIGHFRRYDAKMMRALKADALRLERIFYLDSTGIALSLMNRFVRRKGTPSARPILIWDRCFVPCSRLIDPLTGYRLGKTIVGIWKRLEDEAGNLK
jgi:SAM-dependent methyltransferase